MVVSYGFGVSDTFYTLVETCIAAEWVVGEQFKSVFGVHPAAVIPDLEVGQIGWIKGGQLQM